MPLGDGDIGHRRAETVPDVLDQPKTLRRRKFKNLIEKHSRMTHNRNLRNRAAGDKCIRSLLAIWGRLVSCGFREFR